MSTVMRRLRSAVLTTGAVLGSLCLLWTAGILVAGVTPLVVLSGSMSPALQAGDLAFARTVPVDDVRVGDVVSVVGDDGVRLTHRVFAIDTDGNDRPVLRLKGDANASPDAADYSPATVDRVVGGIPQAGRFLSAAASPWAMGGAVVLLASCLAIGAGHARTGRRDAAPRETSSRRARAIGAGILVMVPLLAAGSASAGDVTLAYFTDTPKVATPANGLDAAPWFTCDQAMTSTELGAFAYYRFDEALTATTVTDSSGNGRTMGMGGTYTFGQGQPCGRDQDTGARISGGFGATPEIFGAQGAPGARWNTFTLSLWFRGETATTQGHLIGMTGVRDGSSGLGDRRIYVDRSGRLHFGVIAGSVQTIATPAQGQPGYINFLEPRWHMVSASLSPAGLALYVDGERLPVTTTEQGAAASSVTSASQGYPSAYWTVGAGPTSNAWPGGLTDGRWRGPVSKVGIWTTALTDQQIRDLYRSGSPVAAPTPSTSSIAVSSPTVPLGTTIGVSYVTDQPDPGNWIGIYRSGGGPTNALSWGYAREARGVFSLQAPRTPGVYTLWYVAKDTYTPLAPAITVTVK